MKKDVIIISNHLIEIKNIFKIFLQRYFKIKNNKQNDNLYLNYYKINYVKIKYDEFLKSVKLFLYILLIKIIVIYIV